MRPSRRNPLAVAAQLLFARQSRGGSIISDAAAFIFGGSAQRSQVSASDFLSLAPAALNGGAYHFSRLRSKVALITNVASE
mmetsp:Transcript_89934/g.262850  ORF Transcript_89934/g.262850 Transcript_89934/m.262850 type:complete len:81 (+) Transcript_89934:47-289(+)